TSFGASNEACFRAGLGSALRDQGPPTFLPTLQSQGDYDVAHLRKLIRSAVDQTPKPDLIVAAGGPIMAQAPAPELQEPNPKFIFLSGDDLEASPTSLAGGINLNTPGANEARRALLKSKYPSVRDESMYLVVNDNNPMAENEARTWPRDQVARFFR